MYEKPRRRWFAFGLRTLFVLIAVVAAPLAWVGVQLKWIADRHALFESHLVNVETFWNGKRVGRKPAPAPLGLFGEQGAAVLSFDYLARNAPTKGQVERLFPEAEVVEVQYWEAQ